MQDRVFIADYLASYFDELEPKEFYRAIFPAGELASHSEIDKQGKYNAIAVELLPKEEDRKNNLYKIILTGKRFFPLNLDEIKKMVQTENIVKIKDKTKLGINIEQIANENNIKGIFVKNMLEKKEKEKLDDDFIEKAIC